MYYLDILLLPFIWIIDVLNKMATPFKPFTRSVQPKYTETLEDKEVKFFKHLQIFWQGSILNYRIPIGDAGDQCLHHGLYTTMLILRGIKTHDDTYISKAVAGLYALQNRTNGRTQLIRGITADGSKTQNVSNDQLSGHLLALYYYWKYVDKEYGADLIDGIATELLEHNHCLVNPDAHPTKHGKLINGVMTDPLNLTLCLAVYLLGYKATGKDAYFQAYKALYTRFKWRIPYANFRFLWLGQTSVPVRAAIHYHILWNLDPIIPYHKGFTRLVKMEQYSGSPVITWLGYGFGTKPELAVKHLQEYTLEDKVLSVTRVNSSQNETVNWGGYRRVRQPLPRWAVRSEEFFDMRMWWSCDDSGTGEEHNGGDFLLGYWGLRFLNLL